MRLGVNDKNFGCMIFLIYITGSVAKHIKQETEEQISKECFAYVAPWNETILS